MHGDNKLQLSEDDDIINDGFLQYLQTRIPKINNETEAKIYKVALAKEPTEEIIKLATPSLRWWKLKMSFDHLCQL